MLGQSKNKIEPKLVVGSIGSVREMHVSVLWRYFMHSAEAWRRSGVETAQFSINSIGISAYYNHPAERYNSLGNLIM